MFKSLVCAVSEQFQEIKQGLSGFPYFDSWDADTVAECCRLSSVVEFTPDKIILGPGLGDPHTVHFVLVGVCRVVQHLLAEVKVNSRGKVVYKLLQSADHRKALTDSRSIDEVYSSRLFNQKEKTQDVKDEGGEGKKWNKTHEEAEVLPIGNQNVEKKEKENQNQESKSELFPESLNSEKEIIFESDHHLKVLEKSRKRREDALCGLKTISLPKRSKNVKSFFIEVGTLFEGASFGLGNLGKENFVMSHTAVKVLKIPLRFLLVHNPCNIWNRISLFYSLYLFKDEKVFDYYLNETKWKERKKNLTEEIFSRKKIPNYTSLCDSPYSVRLSTSF